MPLGRPPKYKSEEDRRKARKAQIYAGVKAYRARRALQRTQSDEVHVRASSQHATSSLAAFVSGGKVIEKTTSAISQGCGVKSATASSSMTISAAHSPHLLHQHVNVIHSSLDLNIEGGVDMRHLFYYFRQMRFGLDFLWGGTWLQSLLQAAHSEPAIAHAIVTVASIHHKMIAGASVVSVKDLESRKAAAATENPDADDHLESRPGTDSSKIESNTSPLTTFGVAHYNHAIRRLLHIHNVQEKANMSEAYLFDATIFCCMLFICIHGLLGDTEAALMHINNGFDVIREHTLTRSPSSSQIRPSHPTSVTSYNHGHYLPRHESFKALDMVSIMTKSWLLNKAIYENKDWPQMNIIPFTESVCPQRFAGIPEAKESLEVVFSIFHYMVEDLEIVIAPPKAHPAFSSRVLVSRAVPGWWKAFEALLLQEHNASSRMTVKKQLATLTLRVYLSIVSMWAKGVSESPALCVNESMRTIMNLSLDIVNTPRTALRDDFPPSLCALRLSAIPALYWIATMCSDAATREEALQSLEHAAKDVALWDVQMPDNAQDTGYKALQAFVHVR